MGSAACTLVKSERAVGVDRTLEAIEERGTGRAGVRPALGMQMMGSDPCAKGSLLRGESD